MLCAVNRVLVALQESYPGLFVLPKGAHFRRREIIQELLDSERAHVNCVSRMVNNTTIVTVSYSLLHSMQHIEMIAILSDQVCTIDKSIIQCLAEICTPLLRYHEHVLSCLEKSQSGTDTDEEWDKIFAIDVSSFWKREIMMLLNGSLTPIHNIQADQNSALRIAAVEACKSYCANVLKISGILEDLFGESLPVKSFCSVRLMQLYLFRLLLRLMRTCFWI